MDWKLKNRFQKIIIGRDPCMGECFSLKILSWWYTAYTTVYLRWRVCVISNKHRHSLLTGSVNLHLDLRGTTPLRLNVVRFLRDIANHWTCVRMHQGGWSGYLTNVYIPTLARGSRVTGSRWIVRGRAWWNLRGPGGDFDRWLWWRARHVLISAQISNRRVIRKSIFTSLKLRAIGGTGLKRGCREWRVGWGRPSDGRRRLIGKLGLNLPLFIMGMRLRNRNFVRVQHLRMETRLTSKQRIRDKRKPNRSECWVRVYPSCVVFN